MHAKTPVRGAVASFVGAILCSTGSAALAQEPLKLPGSQLDPIKWTELAGWPADDHLAAFAAYQASCRALRKNPHSGDDRPIHRALWNVCRRALDLRPQDSHSARAFFEENFHPVRIAPLGEADGLLTGYFEPIVQGSRRPNSEFHVPVYRRPPDLVAVGYKPGADAFPNKGARIGRLNEKGQLVPYYDRAAIEAGALDGQNLEICWLKDPSDLLTIQIQGSGRVILEDGTPLRISYDSYNGYSYASSSSSALIKPNRAPRGKTSIQRSRTAPPDETAKAHAINRSYVFFRITGLSNDGEPIGAQGVPLTPGRSIAVDRLHDYGTPFFIEANLPIESAKHASAFQRLMIAQDTGSAIVGPARADLYWGAGDDAGHIASRIRHPGRFVMLLPRELDMIAAGKQMPLPLPKPKFAEVEVRKHNGKGEADWAKSKVDPRVAAAYARGATGARIDSKPPASPSAPRSVAASKQVKQVEYQSTGITVPSYGRNSRQADNSTVHNKQIRLNSPSRGRTPTQNWVR
jgi:membrane-bound lytic murein transglycosylase A